MKELHIKNYNDMIYDSGPVKYTDFVSNKYNILHKKLYNDALIKLINDLISQAKDMSLDKNKKIFPYTTIEEFYDNTKIIELKNDEYWKPSAVLIINKNPHNRFRVTYSLEKYWNTFLYRNKNYIENIKLTENKIYDAKVKYINYVSGEVDMESQAEDIEFTADFDLLNKDTEISDDYILSDTFTNKYYGI